MVQHIQDVLTRDEVWVSGQLGPVLPLIRGKFLRGYEMRMVIVLQFSGLDTGQDLQQIQRR